ncbi:MAG: hypothetical protein HKN96_08045, partial [Flavobacteriaceae bacterium]|nr:hypothetical protein [Flavobacteriaceae bacterium]
MKLKLLTLTLIFCAFAWQFDVNAQDLKFDNLVLVSGVDKEVGAIYRQTLAAPGIDATITIVDLTGGTTLHTFDDNGSGMIDAFQPTVTKSATLLEEYARFQFDFFVTGTSTPTNVVNAEVNAVDVDGCCGLFEYSVYHGADSYTVETPTALTAYEVPEGIRFQGPYGGPTSIDYSRTDYIAKVKYNATDSFTIDIGSNGNSVWPDRQASVYFKEISFASPVTTLTTDDHDNDGILDSSDVDDDNDGVLDVDEANLTTTGSFSWTHNTTGSNLDLDYMNPNLAGWFLSSSSLESWNNISVNTTLSRDEISSVSSSTFAQAVSNAEYLEYSFTIGGTAIDPALTQLRCYWAGNTVGDSYQVGVAISDDNFATSTTLNQDINLAHVPSVNTYYTLYLGNHNMKRNTTYTLRVYTYNVNTGSSPNNYSI